MRLLLALIAAAAMLVPAAASAGHGGATSPLVYRSAAYYRHLLLHRPPAYWAGGTTFVPLTSITETPPAKVAAAPLSPVRRPLLPVTLRIPDAYLDDARQAVHPGPLWIKTVRGFRLDDDARP
jgi:hypothetical protein